MREEHRTVTALFADLVGSTPLGERLDEEEIKLVVGEAVGRMVAEVERLGGFVKDLAGDGVLALFGAPTSYEDDAERAARAALNILQAIRTYGAEVASGWGVEELKVRVGISTGPVAVGHVGSGARIEYSAYGDTVNTAARLQAAADPGTVLVDAHTQRSIEPLFDWDEARDLELKGKAGSVRAFSLRGALPAASRPRGWTGIPPAIVGRDREMSTMRQSLEEVRAGAGRIVLISGEAGAGKSRLLSDLHAESALGGEQDDPKLLWLEGRCLSYNEAVPYSPFLELLRDWLGVNEGDPPLRVRISLKRAIDQLFDGSGGTAGPASDVYPYLASLLIVDDDPGTLTNELNAEELQRQTFGAVRTLFEQIAQDRPVVLVLEDLHWADATSTQLARSLLPLVERSAVMLAMTQRDERDRAAWALKEAASRDFPHLVREIALEPLPPEAERTLLEELIGVGTLTPELEARVFEAAEGNPLYLEELVRSLVEAGAVVEDKGIGWRLDHDVKVEIPETVEKVILARADRLPTAVHDVLTAASVVGRRFDLSLLSELVGEGKPLDEDLHELQRLGFIVTDRRWPEPQYRFKHVLIQEALYRTMLSDRRIRLHLASAEFLERHAQDEVLALARHWVAAGAPERAIPYYRQGAELALRAFANQEAVEALTHALDLVAEAPPSRSRDEEELELRTILGVPLVALGGYGSPAVREDYSEARGLCERLGRPVSAPILRGLAISSVVRLDLDDAREHGVALLASARREDDPVLTVEGEYVLGVTSFWEGAFQEARAHLERAIHGYAAEHHDSHTALFSQDPKVVCLSRLAWTLLYLGYPEQAAKARDEALSLGEELGHPFSLCYAFAYAAIVTLDLGDLSRGAECLATLEILARDERFHFFQLLGATLRSWIRAKDGDLDAIDEMDAAMRRLRETGQTLNDTYLLGLIARAYLEAGKPAAGLEAVSHALDETAQTGARYIASELQRVRGDLLRAAGADAADVEAAYVLALEIAQDQEAKIPELRAAVHLTRWLDAQGSAARRPEGVRTLEGVYGWFSEGLGIADLQAAKRTLDDRSSTP